MIKRPVDHLDSTTLISDAHGSPGYWYDDHISWNNANSTDDNPACLSTYRPSNPATPRTALAVNGPWENEVLCIETDGKGSKIWRFAHTYSTAKNGFWSTPGATSPRMGVSTCSLPTGKTSWAKSRMASTAPMCSWLSFAESQDPFFARRVSI